MFHLKRHIDERIAWAASHEGQGGCQVYANWSLGALVKETYLPSFM